MGTRMKSPGQPAALFLTLIVASWAAASGESVLSLESILHDTGLEAYSKNMHRSRVAVDTLLALRVEDEISYFLLEKMGIEKVGEQMRLLQYLAKLRGDEHACDRREGTRKAQLHRDVDAVHRRMSAPTATQLHDRRMQSAASGSLLDAGLWVKGGKIVLGPQADASLARAGPGALRTEGLEVGASEKVASCRSSRVPWATCSTFRKAGAALPPAACM